MYEPIPSDDEGLFASEQSKASSGKDRPDTHVAQRSLDELFSLTSQYRSGKKYGELLRFITRFNRYSLFNSMLIHVQMPGAIYVATPLRWLEDYGRRIRPNAKPILILRPMGPVLFLFDVSDTERDGETDKEDLPERAKYPFEVRSGHIDEKQLRQVVENAKRDGIRVLGAHHGSTRAGSIQNTATRDVYLEFRNQEVVVRYEVLLSEHLPCEGQYTTLVHELAHLYCGHLGTPNPIWWPDRRVLDRNTREFEAESVAYLVCKRRGVDPASEKHLSGYMESNSKIPTISFDRVVTAANLIEKMTDGLLTPRNG